LGANDLSFSTEESGSTTGTLLMGHGQFAPRRITSERTTKVAAIVHG
jgi:hypothetical protein